MRRIAVDQSGFVYFRFDSAEPRMKRDEDGNLTGEQEKSKEGTPLVNITCVAKASGARKPEVITVKVPMAEIPAIEDGAKLAFANLTAYAYGFGNGDAQLSFSADKVGKLREQR